MIALVLFASALAAGPQAPAADTAWLATGDRSVPETSFLPRVPFCPPGEKVVCTLGPPPVCHCE
jgi:hypothetical protein